MTATMVMFQISAFLFLPLFLSFFVFFCPFSYIFLLHYSFLVDKGLLLLILGLGLGGYCGL